MDPETGGKSGAIESSAGSSGAHKDSDASRGVVFTQGDQAPFDTSVSEHVSELFVGFMPKGIFMPARIEMPGFPPLERVAIAYGVGIEETVQEIRPTPPY